LGWAIVPQLRFWHLLFRRREAVYALLVLNSQPTAAMS
jgi:hypothetical protein